MSVRTRSLAALAKAVSLALMGCWVLGSTVWHMMNMTVPTAEVIGGVGVLAFVANMICVLLLIRYKDGDANIRSVWLCSRNDAIGNVAVVISSTGVWSLQSGWPDLIVSMGLASLFLWSALQITRQAMAEMNQHQHA
jgi:Co/Zn/Cd efflux system component